MLFYVSLRYSVVVVVTDLRYNHYSGSLSYYSRSLNH